MCPHAQCFAIDVTAETTPLTSGRSYHFTLSATNRAGLSAFLTSDPYYHDISTPTPGLVLDFDPSAPVEVLSGSSFHAADIDVLVSGETVGVRWQGFSHPTAQLEYAVALGLTPGSHDIVPFTPVGSQVSSYVFRGVALQEGSTYYATVVAETGFSRVNSSSSGVLVLREGVASLSQAAVYNGRLEGDTDYQASTSRVAARWVFPSHLHAHISHYMWAVVQLSTGSADTTSTSGIGDTLGSGTGVSGSGIELGTDMTVIRDYQSVGKDTVGVASVPLLRADGSVYASAVRACFPTRCLPPVLSDGFQISIPPRPGSINATYTPLLLDDVYGSSSSGTLELQWEEFQDPQLTYYEWALVGGVEETGLILGWKREMWSERGVTMRLNVTVSLHGSNTVILRGVNSAGLYATTSTLVQWRVGGRVRPQAEVPRSPLMVYDTAGMLRRWDPAESGWIAENSIVLDIEYTGSESALSGAWPDLRYTQYNYSISHQQQFLPCSSALVCGSTHLNTATVSLPLSHGQRYYFCVQTSRDFALHATPTTPTSLEACSNGVTVDLTPPLGGCIKIATPTSETRDCGSLNATEFAVSTSELYLVWEEFADVERRGNAVHASGVAQYSYAIGKKYILKWNVQIYPLHLSEQLRT